MAQIFISYSRADRQFVDQFVPIIRKVYGNDSLWYDDDIHGGTDWWQIILDEINDCDLFIYLLSNDSVGSSYCQAELREALRLNKQVLPIVIRPKTNFDAAPDDIQAVLRRTQWVDFTKGVNNTNAVSSMFASINRLLQSIPERPLPPDHPEPTAEPTVRDKVAPPRQKQPQSSRMPSVGIVFGVAVVLLIAAFGIFSLLSGGDDDNPSDTRTPTDIAQVTEEVAEEPTSVDTPTETQSSTPSDTPTATETPTATLDFVFQIQTEFAMTDVAMTEAAAMTLTASAVYASATAAQWTYTPSNTPTETLTPTPTETLTPTIDYELVYQETATAFIQTLTATSWTDTPTSTNTPTPTSTASHMPTSTPTKTYTPSITPTPAAGYTGGEPITANEQWQPVFRRFNGVQMVLVPIGCFMMGSNDGDSDEQPVHQQCFDEPFWIDKTEVTRAMYGECVTSGVCRAVRSDAYSFGDEHPINRVAWFEARDYCQWREARLPTEREWEYAARGVDNLVYPWGNTFVADNVVYGRNSGNQTADVGSRRNGASWVDARDMSGNVWEWVSSLDLPYEYDKDDGREDMMDTTNNRVVRGGLVFSFSDIEGSAYRLGINPDTVNLNIGFRCARDY